MSTHERDETTHEEGAPLGEQPSALPMGLGKPAERAIAGAGYTRLDQLTRISERDLLRLHGVGPKAVSVLRRALAERGLAFAEKDK